MTRRSDRSAKPKLTYIRHKRWETAYTHVRDADGNRRQVYLGKYDSPQSWKRFHELAAKVAMGESPFTDEEQLEGTTGAVEQEADQGITVGSLVAKYLRHADHYYRKPDGRPTRETPNFVLAARPLLKLFRDDLASDFGPLKLQEVREAMILGTFTERCNGWCRSYANKQVNRIRAMFKWAVSQELIASKVHEALKAVTGLKKGRTTAREGGGKKPVSDDHIDKAVRFMPPHVAGMAKAQRLIACRPSEIVAMRVEELDMSGDIWRFTPGSHKAEHHEREVAYSIGPKCQGILGPFLRGLKVGYVFSPRRSEVERRREQRRKRKTRVQPSQIERSRIALAEPKRVLRESYSVRTYERAIERACKKAKIEVWCPIQLRKSRATEVRRDYGLEGAQVVLCHAHAKVTEIYGERDQALSARVAAETG